MSRICTSIDQSNKLIKLGIDVNTADMYYSFLNRINKYATVPTVLDEGKYVFINDAFEMICWFLKNKKI